MIVYVRLRIIFHFGPLVSARQEVIIFFRYNMSRGGNHVEVSSKQKFALSVIRVINRMIMLRFSGIITAPFFGHIKEAMISLAMKAVVFA